MANDSNRPENHPEEEKPKITVIDRRSSSMDESEFESLEVQEEEERLPTYVEQLKKEAEEKDKRLREYIAAYKEKTGETDELRARLQRDNENRLDQLKANLFVRLVDILANLKRASEAAQSTQDFESLKQGIEMVIKQFTRELKENQVEPISTVGEKFDPKKHEVFMMVDTNDPDQDNTILEELEPGYQFKEKLIKAAKVKVARLKQPA